jgi:predicted ATP-dependent endonuclease of OLD family
VKLRQVTIAGYRSIREPLEFVVDDRITVVLGANDHGKTNVLQAIRHLNDDNPFVGERDLNWDYHARGREFPHVEFKFGLSDEERTALLEVENIEIRRRTIREFREGLEEVSRQADQAWETAKAELGQANAALTELQAVGEAEVAQPEALADGAAEAQPAKNAAAIPAAQSEVTLKTRLAEEAEQVARQARQRIQLALAEEMAIEAGIRGEERPDFGALAEEAVQAAGRASTNAKAAQTRAETAEATRAQVATTQPTGSEELTKADQDAQTTLARAEAAQGAASQAEAEATRLTAIADAEKLAAGGELAFEKERPLPEPQLVELAAMPTEVVLARVGVEGKLVLTEPAADAQAGLSEFVMSHLPRVELIEPQDSISDVATTESIGEPENDFMRGIFRYAGLEPEEWPELFAQSDRTTKRLDRASAQLDSTLSEAWSQGKGLDFKLDHEGSEIHLRIDDPAVDVSYARASKRSSGFTHFFALKTVLYARERATNASSFLWLFDEPGIYLHPAGQHDLLQMLETLAQANQAIYSTHSIFLINKNFPTRHRLLKKDKKGTAIDQKPYAGQWRAAIDALGLSLPGTVLFASKVLMVEGDSDPILINSDLQKLIELGDFSGDINSLSIMATGDSKHADALTRILLDSAMKPTIAFLFDGDKGGSDRLKNLKKLLASKKIEQETLPKDHSGEDYVLSPELFREATILYAQSLSDAEEKKATIRKELEDSWQEKFGTGEIKGVASWSREEGKRVLDTKEELSSVGIATAYSRLIADADEDKLLPESRKRAIELAEKIQKLLDLPSQLAEQTDIIPPS